MNIKYIELKTGYCDDGPAWIGNVKPEKPFISTTMLFKNIRVSREIIMTLKPGKNIGFPG